MSYLVLARKYRPQTFDEVIGQAHITDILKKGVAGDRVHHAYLFCGPRGIGKTSCARILAKSLNCQEGPRVDPCGKCFSCQEIAGGNSFDVIEIDGASNRGIDEIRTLRENVKFAPSYGKYKIYIVDEVHMLTSEAFNALLKTLEEPPEHAKFIFATTESNKVPATIISRCQRFDFKRISLTTITESLQDICARENFTVDSEALFAVAKAAGGSMRDALSTLDQLSALSDRTIVSEDVFGMLGLVETQLVFDLVDNLGDKDCGAALGALDHIINQGKDIKQLGRDLTEHFRHLLIIKVGGKALGRLVDYPNAVKDMLLKQCDKFSVGDILNAIDLLIEAQEVARVMETQRMPLEVAFAKITYGSGNAPSTSAVHAQPRPAPRPAPKPEVKSEAPSAVRMIKSNKGQVDVSGFDSEEIEREELGYNRPVEDHRPVVKEPAEPLPAGAQVAESDADFEHIKKSWNAMTFGVSKQKMSVAAYLQEGRPYAYRDGEIVVAFSTDHAFQKECVEHNHILIEDAFAETLGFRVRILCELIENFDPGQDEEDVQSALNMFGGEVTNQWHGDEN